MENDSKRLAVVGLIIGCALFSGCKTARAPYLDEVLTSQVQKQIREIRKGSGNEEEKSAKIEELTDRKNQVVELVRKMDEEMRLFEDKIEELTGQANIWGIESVVLKRAGLVAGIGAATLVVASPANAVWVAALSGFSGAINGFSASSESEGFSKSVIAAYVRPIVEDAATAVDNFSVAKARQLMWDDAKAGEFVTEIDAQRKHVAKVYSARLKLSQPVVASDEVAKQTSELLKVMNDKLDLLKNTEE